MITNSANIIINRPPETVFNFLTDLKNIDKISNNFPWMTKKPKGPLQVGSEFISRVYNDFGGVELYPCVITELEKNKLIRFTKKDQDPKEVFKINSVITYRLEPFQEQTNLTLDEQNELKGVLSFVEQGFIKKFAQKQEQNGVAEELKRWKKIIEAKT